MGLLELVEMAEKSYDSYDEAVAIFQQKYAEKLFEFQYRTEILPNPVIEEDDVVIIYEIGFVKKVLKYFGASITKLKLDFDHKSSDFMKLVHKYCSGTLFHLELMQCSGTEFEEIYSPFRNIETLSITDGKFVTLNSETLNFTDIFPQLRSLKFDFVITVVDKGSIHQIYPNLENFYIRFFNDLENGLSENDVEQILRLNPFVSSLSFEDSKESFLEKIEKILPELRTLEIYNLKEENSHFDEIVFKNVRKLIIRDTRGQSFKKTRFVHLDELLLNIDNSVIESWDNFLLQHSEITKLTLAIGSFKKEQLLSYADTLKHLEHASIRCDLSVDEYIIKEFLGSTGLKTLKLDHFNDGRIELLQQLLSDE